MERVSNLRTYSTQQIVDTVISIAVLIIGWFVCYLWVVGMTESLGAPWDIAPVRPPLGHWQRTINDFFERGIGAYIPTMLFFAIQIFLYIRTIIQTRAFQTTTLIFGVCNIVVFIAWIVFSALSLFSTPVELAAHLSADDWLAWGDFRHSWPNVIETLCWFVGLLWMQPILARARASRSPN